MFEIIWFILWGVLWAVYFVLDGFDFGAATLLPFVSKSEADRKSVIGSMGPFWDGNEVWLITAGGVTFAAFPKTYATMFSTMYSPLMLILFALIFRGVSFEFRDKVESPKWRAAWDNVLVVSSLLPAILFGVAFGNIFRGIPFDGQGILHGNLLSFLNPYSLYTGLFFLVIFIVHGALWISLKTDGELSKRASGIANKAWPVLLLFAVGFLVWTKFETNLWNNYFDTPAFFVLPALAVVSLLLIKVLLSGGSALKAWVASSVFIVSAVLFGVTGLYPNLFPSSLDAAYNLTAQGTASSPLTLKIMLGVVFSLVPIVIAYQAWVMIFFKDSARSGTGAEQY